MPAQDPHHLKFETLEYFALGYPDLDFASLDGFFKLMRVSIHLDESLDRFLASRNLSQGRWTVLILLRRERDQRQMPSRLAEMAGVTPATMTGLIDGLEREGLVKRSTHPQDRRKTLVTLTARGGMIIEQVLPEYYRRIAALMDCLAEDEREQFADMVQRIDRNLNRIAPRD